MARTSGNPANRRDNGLRGKRIVKRVPITGMSGTGKSSLLHELAARGYRTVDTDYGDNFGTVDGERLWRDAANGGAAVAGGSHR